MNKKILLNLLAVVLSVLYVMVWFYALFIADSPNLINAGVAVLIPIAFSVVLAGVFMTLMMVAVKKLSKTEDLMIAWGFFIVLFWIAPVILIINAN